MTESLPSPSEQKQKDHSTTFCEPSPRPSSPSVPQPAPTSDSLFPPTSPPSTNRLWDQARLIIMAKPPKNKKMFTTWLNELRLASHNSEEDLAHATKIPLSSVKNIFAGNYFKLPHDTITRGFVQCLARNLAPDPDPIMAAYRHCFPKTSHTLSLSSVPKKLSSAGSLPRNFWHKTRHLQPSLSLPLPWSQPSSSSDLEPFINSAVTPSSPSHPLKSRLLPLYTLSKIAIILFALGSTVAYLLSPSPPTDHHPFLTYTFPSPHPHAYTLSPLFAKVSSAASSSHSSFSSPSSLSPLPSAGPYPSLQEPLGPAPAHAPQPLATASVAAGPSEHRLEIHVHSPLSLFQEVDGKAQRLDLAQGIIHHIVFYEKVRLLASDYAHMSIYFNGQHIGPLGGRGESEILSFAATPPTPAHLSSSSSSPPLSSSPIIP